MRILILLMSALLLVGCATCDPDAAVTPYDAQCLHFMQLGRDYTAQARFELAREQYLIALAASKDAETRNIITRELAAVDRMIQTER